MVVVVVVVFVMVTDIAGEFVLKLFKIIERDLFADFFVLAGVGFDVLLLSKPHSTPLNQMAWNMKKKYNPIWSR